MTNINSPGFTKSSRGSDTWSDNLTVADPSNGKLVAQAESARTPSKNRFAEHLTSTTLKPGALAHPAAHSTRPLQARSSAPTKQTPIPQEPTMPAPKNPPRSSRPDPTPAPWERAAPRHSAPIETPTRAAMLRPAPAALKSAKSDKPDFHTDTAQTPAPLTRLADFSSDSDLTPIDSVTADAGIFALPLNSPESGEDWQQRLQAMMAAGSPELFMQQSPALALLAGHLELLEPSEIPALVSQSPLLQAILGNPQTADVLQTAMPLEQNLQALGLAPMAAQAQTVGPVASPVSSDQASQPVMKLADTLQALGFDVRRIVQEGDLLKDTISLEGLQPYMQRAERLQSTLGLPIEWPVLPSVPVSIAEDKNSEQPLQDAEQAMDPALMAQLSRLAPQNQPRMEPVHLWSPIAERPGLMPLTVLAESKSTQAPVFIGPADASAEGEAAFAGNMSALDADPRLPPPGMDEVPVLMNVLPRAPSAAQDPFLAMAQRWHVETLQTLHSEDFVSRERIDSTPEQLVSTAQPARSLDEILNLQLIQAPDMNNRFDSSTMQDNPSFDINMLADSPQDLGASNRESGGDFSGRNPDPSFLSQDSHSMFAQAQGPTASNKAFSIETASTQAPSATVSPKQLQDIFDNSSMLIKEGGGSIRLDLGSKDTGPLDLALDIRDNTVELRIVTHSDQAREALVQELPRLREFLQNQNLNLEKVEIGLSYGSAWSESSGNGQQKREQFFENTSERSSRGPQGISSSSRSYRQSFVSTPEAPVPMHSGLIQVRV